MYSVIPSCCIPIVDVACDDRTDIGLLPCNYTSTMLSRSITKIQKKPIPTNIDSNPSPFDWHANDTQRHDARYDGGVWGWASLSIYSLNSGIGGWQTHNTEGRPMHAPPQTPWRPQRHCIQPASPILTVIHTPQLRYNTERRCSSSSPHLDPCRILIVCCFKTPHCHHRHRRCLFDRFTTNDDNYSFGGTPKARQPLMFCPSLCPSRSHVHTSGTKPAVCLLGFYVVSCNSSPSESF